GSTRATPNPHRGAVDEKEWDQSRRSGKVSGKMGSSERGIPYTHEQTPVIRKPHYALFLITVPSREGIFNPQRNSYLLRASSFRLPAPTTFQQYNTNRRYQELRTLVGLESTIPFSSTATQSCSFSQ
ncbi:MAG: hypothetical protein LAT80_15170, partial [Balneolaceae bacterium]|nr:hypothetical protein [Balneolaceae bacterium]